MPMFGYYGMFSNPYYIIGMVGVLLASILMIWAQTKVQGAYSRYKKIQNRRGLSGSQIAREILDSEGLHDIEILEVKGNLSDHYNPGKKTINLSSDIYNGTSIASLAVAAHECGHAIQYKEKYAPISMRNAILPIANVGQYLGWIAIFIGFIVNIKIAWLGFFLMCGILAFQVVTLPVEFNASSRALHILNERYLDQGEYEGAKSMLSAAAMTYVAAMVATLMSMLRIFLMIIGSQRND